MDAVFAKALEALAGFWQKVLLPALQDVWKEISEHVLPVFKDIATWIADKLGPVLQDAGKWIQDHLVSNFDAVVGIIQTIIGWINTLAERIRNMQLPDWLTPGSPTPFELGLVGISRALQGVTGGINLMNQTLATSTVYGPSTSNNQVTSRGNARAKIFVDDSDHRAFLDVLRFVVKRFNWLYHAYCLMSNNYQGLLIETPEDNLSRGMRQLNGIYTQKFNWKRHRSGHLLQGRYKAILVDKDEYLRSWHGS